jgi:hypothetical protein
VSGVLNTAVLSAADIAKDDRKNNSLLHFGFLSIQGAVPPDLSRHLENPLLVTACNPGKICKIEDNTNTSNTCAT